MKIKQDSIKSIVSKLNKEYFLPSIQRSFVWEERQIIGLFDSLYRDYPVGNSIIWKVEDWNGKDLPLFDFVKSPKEHVKKIAEQRLDLTQNGKYSVVLDGQQRLTSLFIGLRGSFKTKKPGKGLKNSDSNFVEKYLYFDLYNNKQNKDSDLFAFMTETSTRADKKTHYWFRLGRIYSAGEQGREKIVAELRKEIGDNWNRKSSVVKEHLKRLFEMVYNENGFSYYGISYPLKDLETVCDVFTRVNTGGTVLKKADLLFSNLMLIWKEEGKREIKEVMDLLQDKISDLSQDFVMRSCLYLSGLPVKYNLKSFTKPNIKKIIENWPDIKTAVDRLIESDNLSGIGYIDGIKGLSENALIPILYFYMLKGKNPSSKELNQIKKYYVSSQIFGTFGGNSDNVLSNMRDEIDRQFNLTKTFNYDELKNKKSFVRKFFLKDSDDIEDVVDDTMYGTARAYYILSQMSSADYSGKDKKYHMDHIHPKAGFTEGKLAECGCKDRLQDWLEMRNQLPNLQLLRELYNKEKSKTPIAEYVASMPSKMAKNFRKENFLPPISDLELKKFDKFYEDRKERIVKELCKILDVNYKKSK